MPEKTERRRRAAAAAIGAGVILVALSLGPGREVLTSAAETLYSAWLFARYLVLAVPGGVWWAIIVVVAMVMAVRSVVLAAHTTDRAVEDASESSRRVAGTASLARRARVRELASHLERSGEAASSRANIDRAIAEIAARRLGATGWSRRYADELAADPRIAAHPQLRQVVRLGPDYTQRPGGAIATFAARVMRPARYRAEVERRKTSELERVDALIDGLSQLDTGAQPSSSAFGEEPHERG